MTDEAGRTRVVFRFENDVRPEYRAEYVDPPLRMQPSGQEIEADGQVFVSLTMTPAAGVDLSGDEPRETFDESEPIRPDSDLVVELVETEDFEAVLSFVIGLERVAAMSVTTEPGTLILDLR